MLHTFGDEAEARLFEDVLYAAGVRASVSETREDTFLFWVHDEAELGRSKEILAEFLANPRAERFTKLQRVAKAQQKAEEKAEKKSRHKVVRAREAFGGVRGMGPLTIAVIAISVFVAVITDRGTDFEANKPLLFVWPVYQIAGAGAPFSLLWESFVEVMSKGEVWRLITPVFLHFGLLHIVFNLLWWKDLAGTLERIHGTAWLLLFFLVVGISSNAAEYAAGSVRFGGLSGVVYGLFAYLWMRGKYDPTFPAAIPRNLVIWMMAWYVLCLSGVMTIANWAHTGGLVLGALWGFLGSGYLRRRFFRSSE